MQSPRHPAARAPDAERDDEEACVLAQSFIDGNWDLAWTSLPSIAVMAWLTAPSRVPAGTWQWLALMYVQALHMLLAMGAFRHRPVTASNVRWRRRYLIETAVFAGLCWGSSALFLWRDIGLEQHVILLLYMAGVCAIAGVCNAPLLLAGTAFQVSAWLPILAQLATEGSDFALRVMLMILLFVGIMFVALTQGAALHRKAVRMAMANRRLLAEVSQARATAEVANAAKDRFLAAVSHDLRQPAYALSLLLRTLAEHALPAQAATLVDKARGALTNMRGMLDALLDLTRAQTGALTLQRTTVPVQAVFASVRDTLAGYAEARGLLLAFRDSSLVMDTDSSAVGRILTNLVENAIRYTESGGVLVAARRRGDRVELQVWDTGPGIADADRSRIFESFVQLDNPQRDARRGLGLGLAIVRNLVDALGHELRLRSRVGRGSVVSVFVPRAERAATSPAASEQTHAGGSARVLVIEDDVDVRDAVSAWLTSQRYAVLACGDVDEALRAPDIGTVRAAVVDYRLPGARNGAQQLLELRAALGRPLPALVVTGDTQGAHVAELEAAGLQVLFKPLDGELLRDALGRLLAQA